MPEGRQIGCPPAVLHVARSRFARYHTCDTSEARNEIRMPYMLKSLLCVLIVLSEVAWAGDWEIANRALGIDLFSEQPLLREPAEQVAERLGLAPQLDGNRATIWGLQRTRLGNLPVDELRVFTALDGKVDHVDITVINKGDFYSEKNVREFALGLYKNAKRADDAIQHGSVNLQRSLGLAFKERFEESHDALTDALTHTFGKPEREHMKQSRRRRIERWNWRDVALLLDVAKGEFLILRVLPRKQADAGGRGKRINDSELKHKLPKRVTQAENGDRLIGDIPLVDQGDKGYCAVASGERLLRYMGIPVDSHQLADLAKTDKYGGTTEDGMDHAMRVIAAKNQRSYRRVGATPTVKTVAKYIDQGLPILWSVKVVEPFEEGVRARNKERETSSRKRWGLTLEDVNRGTRDLEVQHGSLHMRLIVGYNPETKEIAYSDTWSGQFEVLWITEREARAIGQRAGLAILMP